MERVARRIRRGVDDSYFADVRRDYERLVDAAYLAREGRDHGRRSTTSSRSWTGARCATSTRCAADNRNLFVAQIAILGLIVLAGGAAMVLLAPGRAAPARAADRRHAPDRRRRLRRAGRRSARSPSSSSVAGAFNEMADAIESDVAARERAEQRRRRGASGRRARQPREVDVPGRDEPRDPHADDRRHRHARGARPDRADARSSGRWSRRAQSSAQSLLQIIGDILDFSKIEAGRLEIAPTTFALRPLTGAAVDTFVHTASAKGLLLTWSVDERAGRGARRRSAAAAPDHLATSCRTRSSSPRSAGSRWRCACSRSPARRRRSSSSVTDTGIGVPAEQQRQPVRRVRAGAGRRRRSGSAAPVSGW